MLLVTKSPFIISLGLVMFSFSLSLTLHSSGCVWVTYTLIIIFLGGIIIVFIYASSINRVFKLIIKIHKVALFTFTLVLLSLFTGAGSSSIRQSYTTPVWLNFCLRSLTVLCVIAILILSTLFIVVKLVQVSEGPLKF